MNCFLLNSKQHQRKSRNPAESGQAASPQEPGGLAFQPSIYKRQVEELGALALVAWKENVILLDLPGVGKAHLAVGLALKALDAGMVVYYTTLSHLITDLKKAQLQGRLERRWRVYLRLAC